MRGEKLEITYINPAELKAYGRNARTHEPEQVAQIVKSIERLGFANPVLVDEKNEIIAGHGRTLAALELGLESVPVVVLRGLTATEKKALRLADNQIALTSGWDVDLLSSEIAAIHAEDEDFGLDTLGFSDDEISGYLAHAESLIASDSFGADDDGERGNGEDGNFDAAGGEVIEDEPPELPAQPKTRAGDVWTLGRHRLMCGDSTSADDVAGLMGGEKADLVFTDPPYGMGKEADGVANDNIYGDKLLDFNRRWIPLSFANLKANGSWYCWGIDEPLMDIYSEILKPKIRAREIAFRNLITWDKGNGQGQMSDGFRMYAPADEKCLFVMLGKEAASTFCINADDYNEAMEPVRVYLETEIKRLNQSDNAIAKALGYSCGRTVNHWWSKSQFSLPTRENYEALREYGLKILGGDYLKREYDYLKREYDDLKREYDEQKAAFYGGRAYFNNTHDNMNNVWHFDRTAEKEREHTGGHATPKPIALCARAIKSSSRRGETVLDLFGGSGSTLIACDQLDRKARLMEIEPKYCDVIIERWQTLTGGEAVRADGVKFNDIEKGGVNG